MGSDQIYRINKPSQTGRRRWVYYGLDPHGESRQQANPSRFFTPKARVSCMTSVVQWDLLTW
jgi:hypothetical protein